MDDYNGFNPMDNNGKLFDPMGISWWLFENTGNPEYYVLYREFFEGEGYGYDAKKEKKGD